MRTVNRRFYHPTAALTFPNADQQFTGNMIGQRLIGQFIDKQGNTRFDVITRGGDNMHPRRRRQARQYLKIAPPTITGHLDNRIAPSLAKGNQFGGHLFKIIQAHVGSGRAGRAKERGAWPQALVTPDMFMGQADAKFIGSNRAKDGLDHIHVRLARSTVPVSKSSLAELLSVKVDLCYIYPMH